MKKFIGFVIKEFYHILRDKRTMLILFGIPVTQILLFGYVITNEIRDVHIAVFDRSKDHITLKLTNKLVSSGYFILEKSISSKEEIEECFRQGSVREVLIFEPDFARKLEKEGVAGIQLITDASDANTANIVVNFTTGIIRNFINELNPLINKGTINILPETRMLYNPGLKGAYMFVPGIMAMLLILVCALMTSVSITREKEMGTMEVLLVSPLKPLQIILGKLMPYILLAFIISGLIVFLGYFAFGVPVKGSLALLMAECLLFIFMSLSIGIMISTVAKIQQVAIIVSALSLMMPSILLSGFIFPIENMPIALQWFCQIMPPKWFVIIIKNIMLKGTGFEYVWKETLILAGMTVFFIFVSVRKFKIRLE